MPGANAGTQAFGINPKGDIMGTYYVSVPNNVLIRGFLLSKGSFTTIDVVALPGALAGTTNALGINPRGDIVGFYSDRFFNGHGFLLSKGSFTEIVVPAASNTLPSGINPKGDIVGYYIDGSGGHGFLLSKK